MDWAMVAQKLYLLTKPVRRVQGGVTRAVGIGHRREDHTGYSGYFSAKKKRRPAKLAGPSPMKLI